MRALLMLDFINEITHPDGLYPEVCLDQVLERGVLDKAARAVAAARRAGVLVVHVVVGFSPGYADWPRSSPLFTEVPRRGALVLGTWGTRPHDLVKPAPEEPVVAKGRVDPFLGTNLDLLLREHQVDTVLLTGVTTDLVVLSTARQAHDLGYRVEVLADATASGDAWTHEAAMRLIARTATVTTVDEALSR
ncbi:cysteine hydrolase family protein [Amycolatopsis sp. cmx-4-68]|uniref:cysteine hydrolase family protein n=1 Tax=Amycolatopsis sp. cmx-4-68 TaxID=2790938 RepID=UPI00397D8217